MVKPSTADIGEITERMLVTAVSSARKPSWLVSVERASPHLDVLGVDAIALITYPDGRQGRLLIQVKSSVKYIAAYFSERPWAQENSVVALLVSPKDSNTTICISLYKALQERRQRSVWHEGVLSWLSDKKLGESGLKRQREIEIERTIPFVYPHARRTARIHERFHLWWLCR